MTNKLQTAIDNLYITFSKYHGKLKMNGSLMYHDDLDQWNRELFSKPLKDLTDQDLSKFVGKVLLTWGDEEDLKHFLPRIFELTAEYKTPYEIWIAFDKLILAEWNKWEDEEKKSINEYLLALWENILQDESLKAEIEFLDYFSSIAYVYPFFTELINIWKNNNSKASIKHLANFIYDEKVSLFDRGTINGFHKKKENAPELISWLLTSDIISRFEQAYFKFEKTEFSEKISWAENILRQEIKKRN